MNFPFIKKKADIYRFKFLLKYFLLLTVFFCTSVCEAPHDNPVDPGNPESQIEEPPLVSSISLNQINMGFELIWSAVDSSYPGLGGYNIYRNGGKELYASVNAGVTSFFDTLFSKSDVGHDYSYSIRSRNISGLEGKARSSPVKTLVAIPIKIGAEIQETKPGYVDTSLVAVNLVVLDGNPDSVKISSENKYLSDAKWQDFAPLLFFPLTVSNGRKDVYVKCKDITNQLSNTAHDSTILDTSPPSDLNLEIVPINNPLYKDFKDKVAGYTPDLNVLLKIQANDLTDWRAALHNENLTFPKNPEYTNYTSNDTLSKVWTLSTGTSKPIVFARFEDNLGHMEKDNIPSAQIEYDTTLPDSGASIVINNGEIETESNTVRLEINNLDKNIFQMNINDDASFSPDEWQPYTNIIQNWQINPGDGYDVRNVYVKFVDKAGNESAKYYTDDIILNPPPSAPSGLVDSVANGKVWLEWNENKENDFQKYIVYRGTGGLEPDSIAETTLPNYNDLGLTNGVNYEYFIRAVDNTGKLSPPCSSRTATPNNKPPIISIKFAPEQGSRETFFTFDASGSSDDATPSDSLEVRWDFGGDGWDTDFSIENQIKNNVQFSKSGNIPVKCEVRDQDLDRKSAIKDTMIPINFPPGKPNITVGNGPFYRNIKICLDAIGNDTDSDINNLSYRWILGSDTLQWEEPGTAQYCFVSETLGFVNIKVQSKDEWNDVSGWSYVTSIEIVNKHPNAGFIIEPQNVGRRDQVFKFRVNPDSTNDEFTLYKDLIVQWKFKDEDSWTTPDTAKSITHSYSNEIITDFNVSLKVTDSDGASAIATKKVKINQPPDQPTLNASPTTVNKRTPVTFTAHASDPDNDEIQYFFDYGDNDTSGWTSQNEVPHPYDKSGSYDAKVIVRDEWGDYSSWSSPPVSVTVNNRAPYAPSNISISPSTIYKNEDITINALIRDIDRDSVKLFAQWDTGSLDSSGRVSNGSGASVTVSGGYYSSGNKSIDLFTKDEEGAQSSITSHPITVNNRNPMTPEISDLPSTMYTCETVQCKIRSNDPDNDQVRLTLNWGDSNSETSGWVNSGQWVTFNHTYNTTGNKTVSSYATDKDNSISNTISQNITINQKPPDINNPSSITITYPELSGNTTVENVATSCAQRLMISSITDNVNWLSNSINRTSINPGESAILTANINWSSFTSGDKENATINIYSNDPDEPQKTVSVTASKGYQVYNTFRMLAPFWEGADIITNNPYGKGTWDKLSSAYGSNNGCGYEPASLTINDNDDQGPYGYFRWTLHGKAPEGKISFYIDGMTAEDHALFSNAVDWAFYFDGNLIYSSTLYESDGCKQFSQNIFGNFSNDADHIFEIQVYDKNVGKEDISFNRVRVVWDGWFVNNP